MLVFVHNLYHLCYAYFITCYTSIITLRPRSVLQGKFSKIYHMEQPSAIVKMSISHTTTKDRIYGYNCPHFTMVMWITSTNYTQTTEDVTNIIGCTALPHNANIIHESTQLRYRWISLWNGPTDVSVILTVMDIHTGHGTAESLVESRLFTIWGQDNSHLCLGGFPASGPQIHISSWLCYI